MFDTTFLPVRCTVAGPMYQKVSESKTWDAARAHCRTLGMDLAIVRSAADNAAIKAIAGGSNWDVWIGLHDKTTENRWVWVDGSNAVYTNWEPGEPNNQGNEDCVHMRRIPSRPDGKWNDAPCSLKLPFVCQQRKWRTRGRALRLL